MNTKSKKVRNRIIALTTATAITLGAVIGVSLNKPIEVQAKVTLRGIESIVEEHTIGEDENDRKPFVILEVVPELNDARLGYLVGGEEPVRDGKSIKDMPSEAERTEAFADLENTSTTMGKLFSGGAGDIDPVIEALKGKAFNFNTYDGNPPAGATVNKTDIRGKFIGAKDSTGTPNGWYDENDGSSDFTKKYGEASKNSVASTVADPFDDLDETINPGIYETINNAKEVLYRKTEVYEIANDHTKDNYIFGLKRVTDVSSQYPVLTTKDEGEYDYIYNWQYFKATHVTNTDDLNEKDIIFKGAGDNLEYFGAVRKVSEASGDYLAVITKGGQMYKMEDLENGTGPRAIPGAAPLGPLRMMRRGPVSSPTPEGETPSPTVSPEGSTSPTPTATPSEGETPTVEPTATLEGDTTPTPESTPEGEPTQAPTENPEEEPTATPIEDAKINYIPKDIPTVKKYVSNDENKAVLGKYRAPFTGFEDLYVVTETNVAEEGVFCINGITKASNATEEKYFPFGKRVGFTQVDGSSYNDSNAHREKGPYYIKKSESDQYMYMIGKDGHFNFKADYSEHLYQMAEYSGGFTNNEWFKQYVFDRTLGTQCDNLLIDVVPVTIDMLPDYVDNADLIYFAGGRYKALVDTDKSDDLDKATAMKILSKVVTEDFPVIIERSTYYSNVYDYHAGSTDRERVERANITLLSLLLMQGSLSNLSEAEWDAYYDAFTNASNGEPTVANITDPSAFNYDTLSDTDKKKLEKRIGLINGLYYSVKSKDTDNKTITYYAQKNVSDASYVQGTVFVNDDWNDAFDNGTGHLKGKIVPSGKVVYADFYDEYSATKLSAQDGFKVISDEYEAEKPIISNYGNWEDFNSTISKATSIRYILNANNSRNMVKNTLKILDIEPYQSDQYTEQELLNNVYMKDPNFTQTLWTCRSFEKRDTIDREWILKNLININPSENTMTDEHGNNVEKFRVNVKQMGTRELVGRNEDLNETYDMIYIGMDTAIMNTDNNPWAEIKRPTPIYNSLDTGLVYTHIGDKFKDSYTSGNDITIDKLRELKDYVSAGYAVLLSDNFFTYASDGSIAEINKTAVDSTSNMYQLIEFIMSRNDEGNIYYGKNVFRKGAFEKNGATATENATLKATRETFSRYLNMAKLNIEVIKKPIGYNEYNEITGSNRMNYLVANSDGSYSLEFEVKLNNDSAIDASNTTYDCKLYLDLDADGKYEEGEALTGLVINDGGENQSDGAYRLKAGNTYKISRLVPDEYVGFLSWKLAFIQNEKKTSGSTSVASSIRSAITGFSAVPNTGVKPVIDVLQITPNLKVEKNGSKTNVNYLDLKQDAKIKDLCLQVNDFGIDVDLLNVSDYINKVSDYNNKYKFESSDQSYFDFLCQYDMVVIGFTDAYWFNDAANIAGVTKERDSILAIREYALSGRSILFTHDLTNRVMDEGDHGGTYATHYLRDLMGLDRFGILHDSASGYNIESITYSNGKSLAPYNSLYDNNILKGNTVGDKIGRSDPIILYKYKNGDEKYGITSRKASTEYNITWAAAPKDGTADETVTAINEGQITQYPFLITEGIGGDTATSQFEVSVTHAQSYQLNLDTDSTDENTNDDVVVWYAISNTDNGNEPNKSRHTSLHEYYKALHNDVRNNYYIYSKGNVTYTGSGHSPVSSEEEKKLFINTLVASYNSGLHAPKVVYKENPWDSSANIKGIYLPYDLNTGTETSDDGTVSYNSGWLDDTVTVNFKTLNNNFRESLANLNVKYYVEDEGGSTSYNGKHYKEIVPKEFYLVSDIGGIGNKLTKSPVASNVLANYKIYQAEFNTSDLQSEDKALIKDARKIYIQIGTEDLSTGNITTLKATESFNPLDIYTTRLFDLE